MPDPKRDLPIAGDECDSCRKFWTDQGLKPKLLVAIRKHTDRHRIAVVVCPYCDGEPILRRNGQ